MTVKNFLEEFQDLLQAEEPVALDARLAEMEEWDSIAVMACMAYLDKKFAVKTSFESFKVLHSVADIVALTNGAVT